MKIYIDSDYFDDESFSIHKENCTGRKEINIPDDEAKRLIEDYERIDKEYNELKMRLFDLYYGSDSNSAGRMLFELQRGLG